MYSVFVKDDGKTFAYWQIRANEEAEKGFDRLESLQTIQTALAESYPEVRSSMATRLALIDTTLDLFRMMILRPKLSSEPIQAELHCAILSCWLYCWQSFFC
jgi:hypothetical protein